MLNSEREHKEKVVREPGVEETHDGRALGPLLVGPPTIRRGKAEYI